MDYRERINLLRKAEGDQRLQAILFEKCKRDPVFWFNTFCWTFDPRKERSDIPFILYPFQEWGVWEWIEDIEEGRDFGVEKSRDMGISYMMIYLLQYLWLFEKGCTFHVGSRKESEVDKALVDPEDTLFGKFRYNLYRLPTWMRPKVRDKKLVVQNLDNNNLFTGDSQNPRFGRGPRKKAILFDEFAFWDCADAAYGGCSQTTPCRIIVSTPYGESNRFAREMLANEKVLPALGAAS